MIWSTTQLFYFAYCDFNNIAKFINIIFLKEDSKNWVNIWIDYYVFLIKTCTLQWIENKLNCIKYNEDVCVILFN